MQTGWVLRYEGLDREKEGLREALCTVGNGVFCTRGAAEERPADGVHYPGNYFAGGFNERISEVAGRQVVNEDLVNFPNWLWLTLSVDGGPWLNLWEMEVLEYVQELDLKQGVLRRRFRFRDGQGRTTAVKSRRLVHMEKNHLAAIHWEVEAEDWEGELLIRSGLDGSVKNENVERYLQLEKQHLVVEELGAVAPEGIYLKVRTNQSQLALAQAARTRIEGGELKSKRRRVVQEDWRVYEEIAVKVAKGDLVRVEKVVAQFTSRDRGIGECGRAARVAIGEAGDFKALLRSQKKAWGRLWRRCDVIVESGGDKRPKRHEQLVLRLHIFHLLQTASPNTVGRDVGIPARGLHGEAYRGHIFWDELFILPFYVQRLASVARSAILYRYYRLDGARKLAQQDGFEGAAYPWQSGSDGSEATQELHLNPMSGRWDPDYSHLQRHINTAIVYNIWGYYVATGDRAFLEEFGAEIVLEIARFWSSIAEYDDESQRFEIKGVMGPDEYHEKYPGADAGGLKNNAYTNITAVWCLLRARDVLEIISPWRAQELKEMLLIDEAELQRWEEMTKRMKLVFHDGVLSQFEGYGELEELDWAYYREKYGHIERMDRILKAEGDSPDRYKVSKQADVTMLLYLFREKELRELVERLGYELSAEDIYRNVEYYRARTSHGSTLSRVVFTSGIHRHHCEAGSKYFLAALESDLCDVQGGTTEEGVHLGAMAGTVDIVMRYYGGMNYGLDRIQFEPHLPHRMKRIEFHAQYRGRWLTVHLTQERLRVSLDKARPESVLVQVYDDLYELESGGTLEVAVKHPEEGELKRVPSFDEDTGLAPSISLYRHEEGDGEWRLEDC